MPDSNSLEADIIERVRNDFGANADAVLEQLLKFRQQHPNKESVRISRCIVHASRGRMDVLPHNLELAATDYRDIIMNGEYQIRPGTNPKQGISDRLHDFSYSFTDERSRITKSHNRL